MVLSDWARKWQKIFGADKSRVMQTEKACPKYTLLDTKVLSKKQIIS